MSTNQQSADVSDDLDAAAEARASHRTPAQRAVHFFVSTPALWPYVVLAVLVLGFSLLSGGTFSSTANLRNILLDGSLLMVVSVGMTAVIITAGIDLSIGAVTIFGGVAAAKVMNALGGDSIMVLVVGCLAAIGIGLAWGALNGFMITRMKVAPLIATLGTLGMATGLSLVVTGGINAREIPLNLVTTIGNGSIFGIPWLVVIAAVISVIGIIYLGKTRPGQYVYAIGSNRDATVRAGVKVRAHTASVYVITGALAGLAGYLYLARFGTTQLAGHTTDNLQAIAAVVLGGTSLFGGRGGIIGTIAGVLIPAVLNNGFVILGIQPFWQQFAIGVVLVLAVYTDHLRRSRGLDD